MHFMLSGLGRVSRYILGWFVQSEEESRDSTPPSAKSLSLSLSHPFRGDKKGEEICMDKRILNEEEGWKKSLVRQQILAVWVV